MRPYKPWFRKATNSWYVEIAGRQQPLGKHPDGCQPPRKGKNGWNAPPEIMTAFHRLMAADPVTLPKSQEIQVAQVCDLFLCYSNKHHKPETYNWYRYFLQTFCEQFGTLLVADLKPLHASRWLDSHETWKGGQRNAVIALKRAFNWAEAEGVIAVNPIKNVKKPLQRHRDRILTPEERIAIQEAIRDEPFRQFVFAMQETGARPGEVRRVTADNVNLELGIWFFTDHKTAHKTGKPRIVYLTPAMVELSRQLMEKYPQGPLFRGPLSKQGFTSNGVRCRFRSLRKRLPHLKGVIAYAYRHSFATTALANGVGIAQVAELLGHVDTKMVSAHYSHLAGLVDHMKDAVRKAREE